MRIFTTRKIQLLFILGLFGFLGNAQDQNKLKVDLPNFTPPTPEAFAITKYGDVPVDEFNGKVNLSIPISEYQIGRLKLPISLNYNGAGVKVNDIATQTGINWTLDAGGLVSREIRDLADEQAFFNNRRINLTEAELLNLNQADCTSGAGQLRSYLDQDYDTEVDIFRFHFLNYSGSFYLDNNFIPVMVKNEQHLKIEIIGSLYSDKTILITDPNGVKFYFGGLNASESTQSRSINGSFSQQNAGGVTSFYLYKVEHPVNGVILLEYDTKPTYELPLSISYSLTRTTIVDGYENTSNGPCPPYSPDSASSSSSINSIFNQKLIKRIYNLTTTDEILFNRTSIDNMNFKTVLNSIEIKKNNVLFSKIDLEYIGLENPSTAKRFFLNKVSFNKDFQASNGLGKKYEVYRLEYNSPDALPARFSKKIDMLGYFNNSNNTTLIPCFPNSGSVVCPNRNANFEFASKGVLEKVIYPTGGYTNFEYEEQPSVEKKYETISGLVYINQNIDPDNISSQTNLHDEVPKTFIDESGIQHTLFQMPILYTQTVTINLDATTLNNVPNHYATVTFKITNLTSNQTFIRYCNIGTKTFEYQFLMNNTYKIEIDITPPTAISTGYSANGSFNFNLQVGYQNISGAGVRIKRVKDFSQSNILSSTKRFYYTSFHKRNDIFADAFESIPNITESGRIHACYSGSNAVLLVPVYTKTIHSQYNYSDFTYTTFKPKDYTNVTVSYGGDNFEQGGVEKTFKISEESTHGKLYPITEGLLNTNYISAPDAKDNVISLDGLELKEKIFKNINGSVFKIQEKKYEYEYPIVGAKLNLFGFKSYDTYTMGYQYNPIAGGSFETVYDHNGALDPLNPTGSLGSFNAIENEMYRLLRLKLENDNSPILTNLDANLASGIYLIIHIFENNYSTVNIILKERGNNCNENTLSNYFVGTYYTNSYSYKKTNEKQTTYIDPIPASLVPHEYSETDDSSVIYPTQDQLEAPYKKLITTQTYEYGTLRGLPTKITTNTSDSAITNVIENKYVNQASTLAGLNGLQTAAYAGLQSQNNVGNPIEVKQYQNANLLSTQRTLYKQDANNHILPEIIQTAKGSQELEDRAIFEEYDSKGNPTLVSLKDGTKTKYLYNTNNQVIAKIENFTGTLDPNTTTISGDPCVFVNQYANSQVTVFTYDAITNLLVQTMDSNCRISTYVYDALHRLKQIKDHDGNVIKEMDNNYRPN
ncbi:MAG: hypothetical protein ABI549_09060 [Flavobacterium sp.]|uniref:hypothetical protein n=1 Tax=Flavobacterium sp. TaxID=239 RepID=UPI00326521AF